MIFTSNYARHGTDPNAVAISVAMPHWYKGKVYRPLAPSWEIVRDVKSGKITDARYDIMYMDLIKHRKLNAFKVVEVLGENAIILCYEAPGEHCHRRLVAEWIKQETGIDIPEKFTYDNESKILKDTFEF